MNIFNKVTLQSLKNNRSRTIVTVIGVVLSTVMITAVVAIALSLQSYMIRGAEAKYGDWHVEVTNADAEFLIAQEENNQIDDIATIQNLGYAVLDGGQNADKPYLFITGWDEDAFEKIPINLISGRLPENSDEVVISSHVASNGGVTLAVGDTVLLSIGQRMGNGQVLSQGDVMQEGEILTEEAKRDYTVVGICYRLPIEGYTAPGYTVITTTDDTKVQSVTAFLTLENPYRVSAFVRDISDVYDVALNDDVLRFMGMSGEKIITVLLFTIGGMLIALIMMGSIFLIHNAFSISLSERLHQFGILMSVGATEKQLRHAVMFEGLCIGALGIPIGILIGIPVIQGVLSLVRTNFANVLYSDVPLTLVLSLPVLAMSIIITLITILISAYIPAKKAAKTPIMTCIRQTNEGSVSTKAIKTSQRMTRILGMEGMLALKNFKRNRRRYRSIILSLTLSMVLFVASTSFGVYLNQIADNSSLVVEDYDICWVSDEMAETEMFRLYDSLKKVDGVTESHYQALTTFPCTLQMDRLPPSFEQKFGDAIGHDGKSETADVLVDVQYVDNKAYNMFLNELNLASGSFDEGQRMLITGFTSEGWYVQGEPIELIFGDGENSKKVMGTFVKDYPDLLPAKPGESHGYTLMVIAPYSQKTVFDALGLPVVSSKIGMTFKSNNPTQSSEKMQTVMNASGITDDYQLYNVYGILDQNRNLSFIISLFSTVFILMITLIAVANVFNTISTSIQLRRREFAMLRSIGMADKDFDKMMRFECAVYGARTMLWALPISIVLSLMIYFGMANGGGNVAYVFPWQSILISITGVVLIVFITMLYGVEKIKKENIIDALRDDIA